LHDDDERLEQALRGNPSRAVVAAGALRDARRGGILCWAIRVLGVSRHEVPGAELLLKLELDTLEQQSNAYRAELEFTPPASIPLPSQRLRARAPKERPSETPPERGVRERARQDLNLRPLAPEAHGRFG
jgi:hypothetical protein